MTGDPDTIGPDVEARAAFSRLAEHGYRHIPVVEGTGTAQKLVGIVSMRDLMRVAMIQPAAAQAHEVPKGLEGVVVADTTVGDVRGLEGFYHYRQYSAVDLAKYAAARRRLVPAVQRPAPGDARRARRVRGRHPPAPRDSRPRSPRCCPSIARAGDTFVPLDALRTAVSQYGATLGFRRVARRRRRDAPRQRDVDVRGRADADLRAVAPAPGARARRAASRARLRRQLPLHDAGQGADAPSTPPRSRSTSSPRSTTASTRRRSPRASSRRPAPTSAPRSSARSARSPVRCTAARRAARCRCSTRSAPRTAPSRGCAPRSSAATGSWASATASTRPTTRAR